MAHAGEKDGRQLCRLLQAVDLLEALARRQAAPRPSPPPEVK